jgi:hypothetical protein
MSSAIDATKPVTGTPTTQSVRDNFAAAKSEIEALQMAKVLRIASTNEVTAVEQLCVASGTPQVIAFNQTTYKNPNDNTIYEFDSINNEVIFHQVGWYNVSITVQGIRKIAGGGDVDWTIHSELKVPAGSFAPVQASGRRKTFDTSSSALFKEFFTVSFVAQIATAGSRLRWMQTASLNTKDVGISSYPASGSMPSCAGVTLSIHKIAEL